MFCTAQVGVAFAQEQAQTFTDVPKDHAAFEAVEYLKSQGIIGGYPDGTFRPNQKVNRAEALKIIIAPLTKEDQLNTAKGVKSAFSDIGDDAWYKPYVEIARASGVVDGPPKKDRFNGENPVLKSEFIKMTLQAFDIDPIAAFAEIKLPLSQDVTSTEEWYYPYMRYGITSSMTMIN